MNAQTAKNHRFHLLDALRGVAAVLVMSGHISPNFLHRRANNGYLAVDFFFCLSGFVIAYAYEDRLRNKLSLREFLVARAIRLYPLAILGTIFGIALAAVTGHLISVASPVHVILATALSLLILPSFWTPEFGVALFPFNTPVWSLFFELVINVVFGILVVYRLASTWKLAAVALLSLAVMAASVYWTGGLNGGVVRAAAYLGLARVAFSFFVGVCLFRLHDHHSWTSIRGIAAPGLSVLIFTLLITAIAGPTRFTRTGWFSLFAIAILFPAIHIGSKVHVAARWIGLCAFLGDMSYPLYVIHAPLLGPLFSPRLGAMANGHRAWLTLFISAVILGVAYFSVWLLKVYDQPIRRFLTRRYKAPVPAHISASYGE